MTYLVEISNITLIAIMNRPITFIAGDGENTFYVGNSEMEFFLMFVGPFIIVITVEQKPTRRHLLFYCTSYRLNMFRALLRPSSGARDYNVDYHIGCFVLGLL